LILHSAAGICHGLRPIHHPCGSDLHSHASIAELPDLAPPQVVVSSGYIGANAQTVESAVTIPLEQAINGVQGMKYISSTSGNDGSSQITVVFDVTRNVDLAAVDVQNRVNQALGRLPNESQEHRNYHHQADRRVCVRRGSLFRYPGSTTACSSAITWTCTSRTRSSASREFGDAIIFGERKYAMPPVARSGEIGAARIDGD